MTSSTLLQQFQTTSALSGGNAAFIEELYEVWLQDPSGVSKEWSDYFSAIKGRAAKDVAHSNAIARIEAVCSSS